MQRIVYWGPQRPGSGGPQLPSAAPVSIQMSDSKQIKQWTWQPRSTTTNLSVVIHLRTGFFQCILYYCI